METTESIFPQDEALLSRSTDNLIQDLSSDSYFTRGRALVGLGNRLSREAELADQLLMAIRSPVNRRTPFMGFVMVSWIGIIMLLSKGNENQLNRLKTVIERWPKNELDDIRSYLKTDTNLMDKFDQLVNS